MKNTGQAFGTELRRFSCSLTRDKRKVSFARETKTVTFNSSDEAVIVTYDSGSDGNYVSEADRTKLGLPIMRISTKRVTVANSGASKVKYVTRLPLKQLSPNAAEADTFEDFPTSLMSVGETLDDGNVSVFTKEDVKVYKEEDVLITCKGKPILVGKRDECGRYCIPLIQQKGQWQPQVPNKRTNKHLQKANSVYELSSTEEAFKWIHAVCGYPVNSTWLKAIKAGNFTGWPMLTARNVSKHYPETTETPKGHLNQSRKNVLSTKTKPKLLEEANTNTLRVVHQDLAKAAGGSQHKHVTQPENQRRVHQGL